MFNISVKSNINAVIRELDVIQKKHIPFATVLALTRTGQHVKAELEREMARVFDRPTAYTMRSLFLQPATKTRMTARVWLKDSTFKGTPATQYLWPQIFGGPRERKRFEKSLAAAGLLPAGMYAVPGSGAQLDRHGNMSRGQITKILSALGASRDPYQNRTSASVRRKGGRVPQYFVGRPGRGLPLGVWQSIRFASGSAVKPILIYTKAPTYSPRFKFFDVAGRKVAEVFNTEFRKALIATGAIRG